MAVGHQAQVRLPAGSLASACPLCKAIKSHLREMRCHLEGASAAIPACCQLGTVWGCQSRLNYSQDFSPEGFPLIYKNRYRQDHQMSWARGATWDGILEGRGDGLNWPGLTTLWAGHLAEGSQHPIGKITPFSKCHLSLYYI